MHFPDQSTPSCRRLVDRIDPRMWVSEATYPFSSSSSSSSSRNYAKNDHLLVDNGLGEHADGSVTQTELVDDTTFPRQLLRQTISPTLSCVEGSAAAKATHTTPNTSQRFSKFATPQYRSIELVPERNSDGSEQLARRSECPACVLQGTISGTSTEYNA